MALFSDFIAYFSTEHFMPHGHCYLWKPSLVALHVMSDGLIALSYFLIPFALVYILYRRKDLLFSGIVLLFCGFIVACGTTHMMEIWTLWIPDYWLSGFIKAVTAIISLVTAIILIRHIPAIITLPSRAELDKSQTRLKNILEGAPDAMVMINRQGLMEMINAQTEKVFGYSRSELIDKPIETLIPGNVQSFLQPPERAMGADLELFGLKHDGTQFPVEISLSPVLTDEGRVTLAAIRDVSEKKAIEKMLLEKNMQLINSDLAKDQFLAHMSHELRTPLNGIISMTQLLMTSDLSSDQKEQLEIINESNEHLLQVINQILDFSKVESGNVGLESVEYDLQELIKRLINIYKVKCAEKKLTLVYHVQENLPKKCSGDFVKIRQVLTNILDNAIKFTNTGSVEFNVSCVVDPVQSQIHFEVIDTGIGIPEDVLPKLFKPFSQGDSSITRRYGGTGLGLAISKRLAEVMGGTITVKSSDKGTKFKFIVPCTGCSDVVDDAAISDEPEKCNDKLLSHIGDILLVEDNKLNQRSLTIILEKLGFSVTIAGDGYEALQALSANEFHLVLMDCQMPHMDGYRTTMEIRKHEEGRHRHVPIIGVTAHAMEGNRFKCMEAGMDDVICKPFNIYDLNKMILKYIPTDKQK